MKKLVQIVLLCVVLVICFLSGCASGAAGVQLTEAQEARIDLIIQHRDEWKETSESISVYPVNRINIYETDNGITVLTVAYVEDGTGATAGMQTFVGVRGYGVTDEVFTAVDGHYRDWIVHCVSVDMENMSDEELRDALEQAYIEFLSEE